MKAIVIFIVMCFASTAALADDMGSSVITNYGAKKNMTPEQCKAAGGLYSQKSVVGKDGGLLNVIGDCWLPPAPTMTKEEGVKSLQLDTLALEETLVRNNDKLIKGLVIGGLSALAIGLGVGAMYKDVEGYNQSLKIVDVTANPKPPMRETYGTTYWVGVGALSAGSAGAFYCLGLAFDWWD